jgi:predicted ATP-dependent serine protease
MVVVCNDCSAKSEVPYHIYGGKCKQCRSYNTAMTGGLINVPDDNAQQQEQGEDSQEEEVVSNFSEEEEKKE